ncbi:MULTISPECIES: hypothetical protein [Streptomyces]|uniref:Uncharacterized protein n=1 Tax=Streptomyces luteosporeus TaxID=173856 RepID=A0ABN3TQY4_9ACTN
MSAHEPAAPAAAAVPRDPERTPSMHDLLASCAAADAVSTPPRAPEPAVEGVEGPEERRDAA